MQKHWSIEEYREYQKKGKENPKSINVVQYDINGNFIKEYNGLREAERMTNIKAQNISRCCKGDLKTAGGFYWKYKS